MKDEDLRKVLNAATQAPSADNGQPWRFMKRNGDLSLFVVYKDRHLPLMMMVLVGCGALLENIRIAASVLGYETTISYFPENTHSEHIADLTFTKTDENGEEELYAAIEKRITDRTPYAKRPLTQTEQDVLKISAEAIPGVSVRFIQDRSRMSHVAARLGINARGQLEDPVYHDYFFKNLRWSKRQTTGTKDGIPLSDLNLNPIMALQLRFLKYWPIAKLFSILGFSRIGARMYARSYLSSGAFAAIVTNEESNEGLLRGGQALERMWFSATNLGLGIQPIAGVLGGQGSTLTGLDNLRPSLKRATEAALKDVREAFELNEERIVMIVRVGEARPRPRGTLRKEPILITANEN